jgi:hypothetical protein
MEKGSKFAELIRLQKESGLCVRAFCANEGIPPSSFYYWSKKLSRSSVEKGFIPLIVKSSGSSAISKYGRGVEQAITYQEKQEEQNIIEIIYPNGTKIRLKKDTNLAELRALIHLYD